MILGEFFEQYGGWNEFQVIEGGDTFFMMTVWGNAQKQGCFLSFRKIWSNWSCTWVGPKLLWYSDQLNVIEIWLSIMELKVARLVSVRPKETDKNIKFQLQGPKEAQSDRRCDRRVVRSNRRCNQRAWSSVLFHLYFTSLIQGVVVITCTIMHVCWSSLLGLGEQSLNTDMRVMSLSLERPQVH